MACARRRRALCAPDPAGHRLLLHLLRQQRRIRARHHGEPQPHHGPRDDGEPRIPGAHPQRRPAPGQAAPAYLDRRRHRVRKPRRRRRPALCRRSRRNPAHHLRIPLRRQGRAHRPPMAHTALIDLLQRRADGTDGLLGHLLPRFHDGRHILPGTGADRQGAPDASLRLGRPLHRSQHHEQGSRELCCCRGCWACSARAA